MFIDTRPEPSKETVIRKIAFLERKLRGQYLISNRAKRTLLRLEGWKRRLAAFDLEPTKGTTVCPQPLDSALVDEVAQ